MTGRSGDLRVAITRFPIELGMTIVTEQNYNHRKQLLPYSEGWETVYGFPGGVPTKGELGLPFLGSSI